jgi:predicted dehydrogenase
MKVLVIGAGMYVTGRHGSGVGTIMASLAQASRELSIESVTIAARSKDNQTVVADAAWRINTILETSLIFDYVAIDGEQPVLPQTSGKFDCVIVSVPDPLHHRYAAEFLVAGIPPLIVKPFTPTLAEARDLVALQARHDTYGAIEFHKRFDDSNLFARRSITEGALGKLLYVTVDYSQQVHIPLQVFRDWAAQTNIFQYLAVHYVDLVTFLTGYIPCRAMGFGTYGRLRAAGIETYDSIHAQVLWRNPLKPDETMIQQLSTNWIDPDITSALSDQKFKIVGTGGRIELDQKNRGIELVTEEHGIRHPNPYFADFLPDQANKLAFQGYGYKSFVTFLKDVNAIGNGRVTREGLESIRPSFRQGLISTAVTEAVCRSLANDSNWIDIDDSR